MPPQSALVEVPALAAGALVEVCDLTWRPFGRRAPVLAGISLRIEAGSRVLLAGPSGSGKSTLLRALAGVLSTTETGELTGSVRIDGSPSRGSSVGLMMQDPADSLVAGRVGREVAFGPESFGMPRAEIWSRVRSALASVGFPYGEDHPTGALSGGETQRLALAGVLALTPRLVLLDEPTSMLDPSSAAVVREAIISAVRASGATLVMVEHQLSQWVDEVDRLVVLDPAGRVSDDGPLAATLARSSDSLATQGVWVPGAGFPRPLDVARSLCAPMVVGGSARSGGSGGSAGSGGTGGHGGTGGTGGTGGRGGTSGPSRAVGPAGSSGRLLVSAESVSVTHRPRVSVMSANRQATATQALRNVCAEVSAGECVAVIGPSGAGKSTLTALLAGVEAPTEGLVRGWGPLNVGSGEAPPEISSGVASPEVGSGVALLRVGSGAASPEVGSGVALLKVGSGAASPEVGSGVALPEAGSGVALPEVIARWTSRTLAAGFGWVPQQAGQVVVARTVRDDVLSTSRRLGLDDEVAQARADGLLEVLGLSALSGVDPHSLSGGEQRRLALAGAIAHGPSVLVLDEPSVGQDRLTWSAVAGVILAARDAGVGVVLATHDPLLIALADRRITLQAGRTVRPAFEPQPPVPPPERFTMPPQAGRTAGYGDTGKRLAGSWSRLISSWSGLISSWSGLISSWTWATRRWTGRWTGLASRSGPLSLLLASIVLVFGAPFISDLRTALMAVGVEVALAPLVLGVGRPPWRRLLPGLFAIASVSFSNWLLSPGRELSTGVLAGLRVAFFVLPSVLLASRIDPSALGDHLGQRLRLPARPVVATVAALHRFEALGEHWAQLTRVRRVRGLGAGRSVIARGRSVVALTFGLLIETLRQAGRMAVAMEARGFSAAVAPMRCTHAPGTHAPGTHAPGTHAVCPPASVTPSPGAPTGEVRVSRRTWAEPAPWRVGDSLMVALGLVVAVIPLFLSLVISPGS